MLSFPVEIQWWNNIGMMSWWVFVKMGISHWLVVIWAFSGVVLLRVV